MPFDPFRSSFFEGGRKAGNQAATEILVSELEKTGAKVIRLRTTEEVAKAMTGQGDIRHITGPGSDQDPQTPKRPGGRVTFKRAKRGIPIPAVIEFVYADGRLRVCPTAPNSRRAIVQWDVRWGAYRPMKAKI